MQELSYQEYRTHMEQLAYLKQKLEQTITKKKIEHAKYRQHHKNYRQLDHEQERLTKQLIEIIPREY